MSRTVNDDQYDTQTQFSDETNNTEEPSNIIFKSPKELEMNQLKSSSPFISNPSSPIYSTSELNKSLNEINLQSNTETLHNSINSTIELPSFIDAQTPKLKQISPWRKFRNTTNITTNSHIFNSPKSLFINKPDLQYKSESNNKEIIKLQVENKCLKNFLRELVDKCNLSTNEYNEYLNSSPNERQVELNNLQVEYDEIYKLNQDLYSNLESFHNQINEKETKINQLNEFINNIESIINDLISEMANSTTGPSSSALMSSINSSLEVKLNVMKLEMSRESNLHLPTPPNTQTDLVKELEKQQAQKEDIQKELNSQIEECLKIKNNFQIISDKFNNLKSSIDEESTQNKQLKQKLEEKDNKIQELEKLVDSEQLSNLQGAYNELTQDYNTLKSNYNVKTSQLHEKSIELRNQVEVVEKLRIELDNSLDKQRKFNTEKIQLSYINEKLQKENDLLHDRLSRMTDTTSEKENELLDSRYSRMSSANTDKEFLNDRVSRSGTANTDPGQLEYINDQLIKENEILHDRLTTTNEQFIRENEILHNRISQLNSNNNNNLIKQNTLHNKSSQLTTTTETNLKKLSILEYQYIDLLSFDILEFSKLINSYNKIADDTSLRDPRLKFEKLNRKLNQDIFENIAYIREKHKSIFEYFIRATDILINDHIKLLLKENTNELTQLRNELTRLNNENYELRSRNEGGISKLRLDDLRNKWKLEREKRIIEDRENKKRFKELELEIDRLSR
ncbi:unnamed protein product [Candida verbasci]|uniref:Mto2p-binding domain-containing protein n=1 Tax=Candida verbasci TaxID=1227364 RepID=A0A9W4XFA4_9ASCO|nr:unnamed protein product [Candida verbasci]